MIRKLDTIQKQENLNTVFAVDEKGNGNANHAYYVVLEQCQNSEQNGDHVIYGSEGNVLMSEDGNVDILTVVSGKVKTISFQNGARKEEGSTHGVLDSDLLEIVRDRLIGFQSGAFASKYNEEALYHVEKALEFMNERIMERASRGVLGTNSK